MIAILFIYQIDGELNEIAIAELVATPFIESFRMALQFLAVSVALFQPMTRVVPARAVPFMSRVAGAPLCVQQHSIQQQHTREQQQQHEQQQPASTAAWGQAIAQGALTVLATLAVASASPAYAENELAVLANSKSTSELVDPQCFAKSCKSEMETCAADGDCLKGLACTAKCMGDAQCTVGCFARYNDPALEKVLQCTIEDAGCIQIATQTPGGDSLAETPKAPKALVKATPESMSGRWYKVLGFNPNYDCFECQRNSFAAENDGTASKTRPVARDTTGGSLDISPGTAAVQVEYSMPRMRAGQPPETYSSTLNEKMVFDAPNSKRTAHTEGRMFGLTFWENWYVIGENQPREPEFRFVYYTGKTLQNRYEGAFVYARKPELPSQAMPSIYKIAREAGLDPTTSCCIDNRCFSQPVDAVAQPPPFTPVAEAGVVGDLASPVYGAPKASAGAGSDGPLASLFQPMVKPFLDLSELLEDPKPYGDDLFSRQRPMTEVREYDANGFRTAGLGAR